MKKYFQAPWSLKDLAVVIGIILFFGLLAYGIIYFFTDLREAKEGIQVFQILLIFVIQWILIFTPLLLLTWRKYRLELNQFGLIRYPILKGIGLVFLGYFIYMMINFIITVVIVYFDVKIPGYEIQESIFKIIGTDKSSIIVGGILIMIIAPLLEEIFFRGFLLRAIANKVGDFVGSILTALAFSLLHFPWQSIIPIFILGLILNGLVIRSKSVWPAVAFHSLNNGIAFILLLLIEKKIISIETITLIY